MLTTLIQKVSNRLCLKSNTQLSIIAILAVAGPVIILIAGIWDAINHIQNEPEFFWSDPHIAVYAGVSLVGVAALDRKSTRLNSRHSSVSRMPSSA